MQTKRFTFRLAHSQRRRLIGACVIGLIFLYGAIVIAYCLVFRIPAVWTLKSTCAFVATALTLPVCIVVVLLMIRWAHYVLTARYELAVAPTEAIATEVYGNRTRTSTIQRDDMAQFHVVRTDMDPEGEGSTWPSYGVVATTDREILLVDGLRQEEALEVGEYLANWSGTALEDHGDSYFACETKGS